MPACTALTSGGPVRGAQALGDEPGRLGGLVRGSRGTAAPLYASGYNVVGAPEAGSFGVVADDDVPVEPGLPESVNEFTWS